MPVQYNTQVLLDYYHHSPGSCESSFENYQEILNKVPLTLLLKSIRQYIPLDELDSSQLTSSHQGIFMGQHNIKKIG
jgi:hypothetical protein